MAKLDPRGGKPLPDVVKHLQPLALLESIPEAIFVFDVGGRIAAVNLAAEHLCVRSREELIGMHVSVLLQLLAPESNDAPVSLAGLAVSRAIAGETVRWERRVLRSPRDGSRIETAISATPVRDDSRVLGALVIVRDLSEIDALQRRIAVSERQENVGQMAAGLAHDFNNVLNTINQSVAVLEMKEASAAEERRPYLAMLRNAVRRGAEIVSRLRDYLRESASQVTNTDVRQLLEESLELTRLMWEPRAKITVEKNLQPDCLVRGNAADLRRAFINIVINAVQAMPEGGTLRLGCEETAGRVVVSIADTGVGIPHEQQKKIFSPYFTTKSAGTGLGLTGSRKIVAAHGGRITFTSEPGKGTTFVIELPAAYSERQLRAA